MGFGRSIVKCAEPLVPWHFKVPVIHLEIAVVHLVMEGSQRKGFAILEQQSFVTDVRRRSGQRLVLHVEQDM